ncbi:MAG TPA: PAS domain S-box protein [Anaerolineales bacterium]|nr:PAS domain S-box protein [Anaerolineales bacterium]
MNRDLNNTELISKLEAAEKRIAELERDLEQKDRMLDDYQLPMVLEDVETDQIIDVPGQKLVGQSLRENEARYRSLFENSPVAIWEEDFSAAKSYLEVLRNGGVIDLDAYLTAHEEALRECVELVKVTDVNQAALIMYEASSKAELLGSLGNSFPNEELTGFKNELLTVAKGELGFRAESSVLTFRGHLRNVIINWIVLPGYEQTYAKVLVTLSDITDLRQAQEKYQDIFENSAEGIFQITPDGRFLSANPALARIYGYDSPQELMESVKDISNQIYLKPEDRNEFTRLMQSKGMIEDFTSQDLRKDGTRIWTSASARAVRDASGNILWYEGFLQDITERREAQHALEENEKRFRAMIENGLDDISLLDAQGHLLWESPAVVRNLGYEPDEHIGRDMFELMHPEDRGWTSELFAKLVHEPEGRQYGTFRLRHANGSWRWMEAVVTNLLGEPSVRAVVVNYRDITERRQAETELQHRNEDLGLINAINELIVRGGNLEAIVNLLAMEMKRIFSSQSCSIYILSPDERSLSLQQFVLPSGLTRKIERMIGSTIPMVQIPIREGGLFQKVLQSRRGTITSNPKEIQNWFAEFAATSFLPPLARGAIRKLIPQIYRLLNINSTVLVPLISNERIVGLLNVSGSGLFTAGDLKRMEYIGAQLTAAILRQRDIEKIERSEKFLESIQNALSANIAILDEGGTIVRVNSAWRKFGEQNGFTDPECGIGYNYLDICDLAIGSNAEEATVVARAIREVITGQRKEAWVEYPCHGPEEHRWFLLRITRFEDGNKIWVVLAHENITERKQAQDDIQRSVAILAQAGKMAHLGAWEIAVSNPEILNENPLHWSDEVYRIFGYGPGKVESTVDLFFERVHPADRQKVQEAIGQAIAGKKPYEIEHRIIRPDGVERILEERADLIYDQQGQVIQILGAVQDITERKRTEQALRETSEQFRTLFEASPEAIMLVDPHGDWPILDCNATAGSMNGYTRQELIGQTIDILTLSPGDAAGRLEYFEQVREAGILRYDDFHRRKDGSIFPIEVSTSIVTLGGREVILGIDRDITERKKAEAALRQSEQRYRALFEDMPVAIWEEDFSEVKTYLDSLREQGVTDFRTYFAAHPETVLECAHKIRILDVNNTAVQMYHAKGKEKLLRNLEGAVSETELKQLQEVLISISGGQLSLNWEGPDETFTGEQIEINLAASVTPGHEKDYSRIIFTTVDITERKQAEETLRRERARTQNYLDIAGVFMLALDQTGTVTMINQKGCEILGYTYAEIIGKDWIDTFLPEANRDEIKGVFRQLMNGEHEPLGYYENPILTRNGEERLIAWHNTLVHDNDGRVISTLSSGEDITERKQMEARLQESEARYRLATLATKDVIWEWKLGNNQLLWTENAEFTFGYSPHEIGPDESWWETHIHPEDRERVLSKLNTAMRRGDAVLLDEYRLLLKDGSYAYVSDHGYIERDPKGQPIRMIGALSNITERKKAEAALRESEEKYRLLFESNPLPMWIYDLKTLRFLKVNDAAINHYGYSAEEFMSMTIKDIRPSKDVPKLLENIAQVTNGIDSAGVWQHIKKDSSPIQVEIVSHVVQFDGRRAELVLANDITERRQAEDELKRSHSLLNATLESTADGILVVGPDRTITSFNRKFLELWRIPPNLAEHKNDHALLKFVLSQLKDPSAFTAKVEALYQSTEETSFDELEFHDGRVFERYSQPQRLGDEVVGRVWSFRDITERKQAAKIIAESEQRYRAVTELVSDYAYAYRVQPDGGVQQEWVTDAYQRITGYHPDELLGEGEWKKLIHPEDLELAQEHVEKIYVGEQNIAEYRIVTKSGQVRYLRDFARPVWDEKEHRIVRVIGAAQDVTERIRAEAELRASEERFRQLADNIEEAFWMTDAISNEELYISPASEKIWGRPRMSLLQNKAFIETVFPEDREAVLQVLVDQRGGRKTEMEYRITRPDGSVRWIWDRAFPIFDDSGKVVRLAGIAADITERKRAEQELRESQVRFSNAFEYATIGMALVSPDGHWLRVNQAICKLVGYSSQELLQRTFQDITHPDDLELDLSYVRQMLADEIQSYQMEKRYFHKQGNIIWVWLSVSLVRDEDDNPRYFIAQIQDITERKQVEEELRKFSRAVEQSASTIVITDPTGCIEYVNPKFTETTGYTFEEALGQNPRMLKSGFTPPEAYERLWKAIISGEEWHGEFLNRKKNGELYWEAVTISPILNERGETTHFIAVKENITERKQNETEITRHLAELEALYENGLAVGRLLEPRAIGQRIIETFSRYLSWHHVTIRLCKDQSDELELVAFHLPHMVDGTTVKEELRMKSHVSRVGQGISGWVVQTGSPLRTSNLSEDPHYVSTYEGMQSGLYMPLKMGDRVLGVISVESEQREAFSEQDERLLATLANQAATAFENARLYQSAQQEIWDRRIAEEALRQSEEKYRRLARELEERVYERTAEVQDLYDNAPCGYHSLDQAGHIIRINQTELNWLGYIREEVLGHSLQDFITDESRKTFRESFPTFKQNGLLRDLELEMLRKDGSIFPTLVSATAIYDKDGRYLTSRSTLFDDTDRKHAMETLRLANSEMKRAMRMKDEFLANMSHELRTPLNAILGLSESLLEQTAGPINEKQQKYLGTVNESGRHLLELINDILDLAKIESGQIKLEPGKVNINTVCDASLRMIKQLAQKKNQTVEVEIENEIGYVWADERRLKQMMVNLLSNAVKFTPSEGQLGLRARVDREDMKLLMTVWDRGIGIPEEDLKRLFRPFVQLDSSLSRESTGTGLGLALVAEMARLHGGSISVSSQPGQGSEFTVILPWDPAVTSDTLDKLKITGKIPIRRRSAEDKRTILLVEDTDSVILMLRDYLELCGYKVEIARDGLDGVSRSITIRPDLILMDVQMPGMDGLEATRRIRRETSLKDTPIIALTALAMTSDRERCLQAGMNDYLSKPINLKELAKTIQRYLPDSGTGKKS